MLLSLWSTLTWATPSEPVSSLDNGEELQIGDTLVRTGGTWEYVSDRPFPIVEEVGEHTREGRPDSGLPPVSLEWQRANTRRVDASGRVWRRTGEGVGTSELVLAETIIDPVTSSAEVADQLGEWTEEPGEALLFERSWYFGYCDAPPPLGTPEHNIWNQEDRYFANYGFRAQKATVLIYRYATTQLNPWDPLTATLKAVCTGTMVTRNYLVTAAHCVSNNAGASDPYNIVVCKRGNQVPDGDCELATSVTLNPGYNPGGSWFQPNEDYAVVELNANLVQSNEVMGLSSASPATWEQFYTRSAGHDIHETGWDSSGLNPTCDANAVAAAQDEIMTGQRPPVYSEIEIPYGMELHVMGLWGGGTEVNFSTNRVKTKVDGSNGRSGSAFFYCPASEDCDQTPYIIGMLTHFNSTAGNHLGPRVERFKQFVQDNEP
jgi:hypothetical protein